MTAEKALQIADGNLEVASKIIKAYFDGQLNGMEAILSIYAPYKDKE